MELSIVGRTGTKVRSQQVMLRATMRDGVDKQVAGVCNGITKTALIMGTTGQEGPLLADLKIGR
jgi:hypothetical protein